MMDDEMSFTIKPIHALTAGAAVANASTHLGGQSPPRALLGSELRGLERMAD